MPHISLSDNIHGIRSLVMYREDTGKALYELAQVLLRNASTLPEAERELIAAFVSSRNACTYCTCSHAAVSRYHFKDEKQVVDLVLNDYLNAPISSKLKALLTIAARVQQNGKLVTPKDVEAARKEGAQDRDIHDTVLIAAAFSMYNRYVDGLATLTPAASETMVWEAMGERIGNLGYLMPEKKS